MWVAGVRIVSGVSVTGPAKSADGKIWFLPGDGVSVIDPHNLHLNKLPPPLHIETVKAEGKEYDLTRGLRLPALVRDVTIDYTALSLVAPENPPAFRVTVEGEPRDLGPILQDEVYRIARELLRNAFRHARAGNIEAEIRYERRQFSLHVRDDGKGIEPEILKAGGRAGHWGLPGMRERGNRFGAKLEFWSEAGAGTEAVLTVPGSIAYVAANGGLFFYQEKDGGSRTVKPG